jgi:hypothetical protein
VLNSAIDSVALGKLFDSYQSSCLLFSPLHWFDLRLLLLNDLNRPQERSKDIELLL